MPGGGYSRQAFCFCPPGAASVCLALEGVLLAFGVLLLCSGKFSIAKVAERYVRIPGDLGLLPGRSSEKS